MGMLQVFVHMFTFAKFVKSPLSLNADVLLIIYNKVDGVYGKTKRLIDGYVMSMVTAFIVTLALKA